MKLVKQYPTYEHESGFLVKFIPVKNVPGFTHKVVILNPKGEMHAKDWFTNENHKISAKWAKYYFDKHN